MRFSKILAADIANGPGWRTTLWVTGCLRRCPGCFNQAAQDHSFGEEFDSGAKERLFAELAKPTCQGLSLMGGEPLSILSDNRSATIDLCREAKERFGKSIWMWSGYTYEEILQNPAMSPVLRYIDVLVDGPFVQERKDLNNCPWRGSDNQRVVDVPASLASGRVVVVDFPGQKSN